jgi:hypothetical protein
LPTTTWYKGLPQEWEEKEKNIERQQNFLHLLSLFKHRIDNIHDNSLTFQTLIHLLLYFSKEISNKVFIHLKFIVYRIAINLKELLLKHRLPPINI